MSGKDIPRTYKDAVLDGGAGLVGSDIFPEQEERIIHTTLLRRLACLGSSGYIKVIKQDVIINSDELSEVE